VGREHLGALEVQRAQGRREDGEKGRDVVFAEEFVRFGVHAEIKVDEAAGGGVGGQEGDHGGAGQVSAFGEVEVG